MIGIGLPTLWEVSESERNPQCFEELACTSYLIEYVLRDDEENYKSKVYGELDFASHEIFSEANPIDYEIRVIVENPQYVRGIFFLIGINEQDFDYLDNTTHDPNNPVYLTADDNIIDYDMYVPSVIFAIPLYHTSPKIFSNSNQTTFFTTGNVTLTGLVINDEGIGHLFENDVMFKLQNFEAKIPLDQNRRDINANKIVLALTWLGLAMAPIILGADFIIRVYLND